MSTKSSTVPVIAWNWVIQALSKFKQVDASTLVGLVKKAPAISDDLGRDAREILSLRILESLFIHGSDEATVDTNSTENDKLSFDPSEHCEDVLRKILEETSEPMTKLEQQKWNVYPFIMHKRSSLPKSSFQKFKEALLDGSHPLLSTLKERSKVGEAANVSENTSYTADVNFDAQTTVAEDDLANENNKLQESVLQKSKELDNFTKGLESDGESRGRKNDTLPSVSNSGPPSGETKKAIEKGNQLETGSDSEKSDDERTDSESDDERTDIAAKKEAFLSSQCTLSQDPMAMNDSTEICVCMRCNKGGQLLVCRSNACLFRVHENCMGSAATLDENGNFYCPFCAYSRSISMYLLVKKNASLARKDLQAFLSLGVEHRQKISSKRGAGLEANNFVVNGNGDSDTVSRGKGDCPPIKPSCGEERTCVSNAENPMLAEPSGLCVNNELDCGDKGVSVGIESLTKRVEVEKKVGEVSESLTRVEELKIGENAAIHSDSLHQPLRQPRMPIAEYNEKGSPASDVSNHSRRSCKRKSPYTSPPIPLLGRKKLQWTKSEEEILKEGVQKFWSVDSKRIPWREILSFGEGVFHKSRTAIDLKDKWRNICKGSPAAKKLKLQ